METKKRYQTPRLTVAVFKAERGYAVSSFHLAIFESSLEQGSENIESRQESNDVWGTDWNY